MTRYVSILDGGTNSHQVSAADFNYLATDFIGNGVVGSVTNTGGVAPSTGSFAVNAQSSPNSTSQVSAGTAYVTATPLSSISQTFRVSDTSGTTITHASNTSGATRYDWIYVGLDPTALANPSADGSSPVVYTVSRSSSNTTDNGTPPTYGINIAIVTLTNSFSSVTNANITDKRVQSVVNSIPGTNSYSYGNFFNPYKFSATLTNASVNTPSGGFGKVPLDTKNFDTGNNFDATTNARFTAPVAGFYYFTGKISPNGSGTTARTFAALYKNGSIFTSGVDLSSPSNFPGSTVSRLVQLSAGDYIELWVFSTVSYTMGVGNTNNFLDGYLVSTT